MTYVLLQPVLDVGVTCEHLPGLGAPTPNTSILLSRIVLPSQPSLPIPATSPAKSTAKRILPLRAQVRRHLNSIQHPDPREAVRHSSEDGGIKEAGPLAPSSNPVSDEL